MPQPRQTPRRLQHHQVPHHIGLHIRIRIDQRVPHPGLRRQMHDPLDVAVVGDKRPNGVLVRHVQTVKRAADPVQPSLFQPNVIIVIEIINADHLVPTRQQGLGHMRPDEARTAGKKDFHAIGRATRRSSSNSSTACPSAI